MIKKIKDDYFSRIFLNNTGYLNICFYLLTIKTQNSKTKSQLQNGFFKFQQSAKQVNQIQSLKQDLKKNRSKINKFQVHFKLAKLFLNIKFKQDSLYHIQKALKFNKNNLQAKIFYGKLLIYNNNFKQLSKIIEQLKYMTSEANIQKQIQNKRDKIEQLQKLYQNKKISEQQGFQQSQNWVQCLLNQTLSFEYIHSGIEVRQSNNGLGLFAKNQIPKHKVIIAERPFMFISQNQKKTYYLFDNSKNIERLEKFIVNKYTNLSKISNTFKEKFATLSSKDNTHQKTDERKKQSKLNNQEICNRIKDNAYQAESLPKILFGFKENLVNGDGLYQFINYINHSCCHNVQRYFIGDYNIIRTVQNIQKDDQICVQYFPCFNLPPSSRKMQSKAKFNFICNCQYCRLNKTDLRWMNLIEQFKMNPHSQKIKQKLKQNANFRLLDVVCQTEDNKLKGELMAAIFKNNQAFQFTNLIEKNMINSKPFKQHLQK